MKRIIVLSLCLMLILCGCSDNRSEADTIDLEGELSALLSTEDESSGHILIDMGDIPMDHTVPKYSIKSNGIPDENIVEVKLCAIGDIMAHDGNFAAAKYAAKDGEEYDFDFMFAEIAEYFTDADYRIGNLETCFAGSERGYTGYPRFNTPEQMGESLRQVLGIDFLSTANNHTLDKGFNGLCATLDKLDAIGIAHTGGYRSVEEAEQVFIADINGAKIAFLAYTYGSNMGTGGGGDFCINITTKERLKNDAQKARDEGADFIIALLHWGTEYIRSATNEQSQLAEWLFESTEVDMIIGNHAHVVEPIEKIEVERDGYTKTGWVFYALGNFTSAQRDKYSDTGIIANITLSIDTDDVRNSTVDEIAYTPIYVDSNPLETGRRYRVLSLSKGITAYENNTDPLLTKQEYNTMVSYKEYYREFLCTDDIIKEAE